jgi:ABC-type lipoprotein release transport system permease subunit
MQTGIYLFRIFFLSEKQFLAFPIAILSLGQALLFSSYCVFSGLHGDFFRQIQVGQPHLTIKPRSAYFEDTKPLLKAITKFPRLRIKQVLHSQGLIQLGEQISGVLIQGLQHQALKALVSEAQPKKGNQIFLSKSLCEELRAFPGDRGEIVLADGMSHAVVVGGQFEARGWQDLKYTLYMDLSTAQSLIFGEPLVNRIEIQVPEFQKLAKIKSFIHQNFPDLHLETWMDRFSETLILFNAENRIHIMLLVLLTILISLSIYSSFYLVFLRKKDALRTLILLGYPRKQFSAWLQGCGHVILLGSLGGGILLILAIRWSFAKFPIPLPQSLFYSKSLPFQWEWGFLSMTCFLFYSMAWISLVRAKNRVLHPSDEMKLQ